MVTKVTDVLWVDTNDTGQTQYHNIAFNGVTQTIERVSLATANTYTVDKLLTYRIVNVAPNGGVATSQALRDKLRDAMRIGPLVYCEQFGNSGHGRVSGVAGEQHVGSSPTGSANHPFTTAHPISSGTGFGDGLTNGNSVTDLGNWNATWHGYMDVAPSGGEVRNHRQLWHNGSTAQVILGEYEFAHGHVIYDSLTSKAGGWGTGNGSFAGNYARLARARFRDAERRFGGGRRRAGRTVLGNGAVGGPGGRGRLSVP